MTSTPLPEQGGFNELQEFIKSCFGMEPKEDWYDSYRYDDRVRIRDFILADRKKHELDAELRGFEMAYDSHDYERLKAYRDELKAEREAL